MLYPKTIKNRVRRLARLRHEKSNIKIRRNAIRCQEKKISKQNQKWRKNLRPLLKGENDPKDISNFIADHKDEREREIGNEAL